MAAVYSEWVVARKWLSLDQFGTSYALSRITPGTNLLAFFAGTGWQLQGWPGALSCVLTASVPPGIAIMLLTGSYELLRANTWAMAALGSVLAAAVGMMATAVWKMLQPYAKRSRWVHAVVITGTSIFLFQWLAMSPIQILGLAAVVGLIWRVPE